MRPHRCERLMLLIAAALAGCGSGGGPDSKSATDAGLPPVVPAGEATAAGRAAEASDNVPLEREPAPPEGPKVKLRLDVVPRDVPAVVVWGRRKLGVTGAGRGLELERPRDSGPLDVIVRAPGYREMHTRLLTDRDDRWSVRLVPLERPAEPNPEP